VVVLDVTDPTTTTDALPVADTTPPLAVVTDTATPATSEQENDVPESTDTQPDATVAPEPTAATASSSTDNQAATTDPNQKVTATPDEKADANKGPKLVEVAQSKWDELQAQLAELQADAKARLERERIAERGQLIAAAQADGRITAGDQDDMVAFADTHGNDGLQALLNRLPKSTAIPTGELGTSAGETSDFAEGAPDHSHLTPEQAAQLGYTTAS
jgi:hypothetical protein